MNGKILDFSIQTSTGIISGNDNKRYSFNGSEWKEQALPIRGMEVDFDIDALGHATGIYIMAVESVNTATVSPSTAQPVVSPAVAPPPIASGMAAASTLNGSATASATSVHPASNMWEQLFSPPKNKTEEQYSPMDWYQKCIWNYVNFKGRARRKEFWFFTLAYTVIIVLGSIVAGPDSVFVNLFTLLLLLPSLAVSARRLHDTGRSGWWTLLGLIPVLGILVLLFWWAQEGEMEANQYGSPVK